MASLGQVLLHTSAAPADREAEVGGPLEQVGSQLDQ